MFASVGGLGDVVFANYQPIASHSTTHSDERNMKQLPIISAALVGPLVFFLCTSCFEAGRASQWTSHMRQVRCKLSEVPRHLKDFTWVWSLRNGL